MFNNQIFNQTATFNQSSFILGGEAIIEPDISYGGYDLDSEFIKFSNTGHDNGHNLDRQTFTNPLGNGITEISYRFTDKPLEYTGILRADSSIELIHELDRLKSILFKPQQTFKLKYGDRLMQGKASLINPESLTYRQHYNITYLPLTLSFSVVEFMEEITPKSTDYLGRTTAINDEYYNKGSAESKPIISISFTTATTVTQVSISNSVNNTLIVPATFSDGDTLIIDCKNQTVKLNGGQIDFTGKFPKLPAGASTMNITPNGTYNISTNIKYYLTYL